MPARPSCFLPTPDFSSNATRRGLLARAAALGLAVGLPSLAVAAGRSKRLRVLAWPGYAEPEVIKAFEAAHPDVQVAVTLIDTDDLLWARLSTRDSADFDVFAANTAVLQRCVAHGLVTPVPTDAVPNMALQLPRFRQVGQIEGLTHRNRTMAVPFTYADMGLIYDRQQWSEPPRSVRAMWDTALKGRVLAYNGGTHNFSLAAQAMGLPSPFSLRDGDWAGAVDRLIALRRNVAGFYSQPDESVALFQERRVALMFANYGSQQLQLCQNAGLDVGYVLPREGAMAWLDCWAITRAAQDVPLAAAWIDHLLGAQASHLLVSRQGLANTTAETAHGSAKDRLLWLKPPEDDARRNRLWSRIVSGDRASKVMASS